MDSGGYVYIAGWTDGFPGPDAFVAKLHYASALLGNSLTLSYSTYLGGSGKDQGMGITVDGSGGVCVVGETDSINYPTTPGAFQTAVSEPSAR